MTYALIDLGRIGRVHAANIARASAGAPVHDCRSASSTTGRSDRPFGASPPAEPASVFADPKVDVAVSVRRR